MSMIKKGIVWKWQAINSQTVAAPVKGDKIGKNPTDRAKNGTKRYIHVDGNGIPIGVSLSGANVHDITMYKECLNSSIIKRPRGKRVLQNICLDKGFDSDITRHELIQKKSALKSTEQKCISEQFYCSEEIHDITGEDYGYFCSEEERAVKKCN